MSQDSSWGTLKPSWAPQSKSGLFSTDLFRAFNMLMASGLPP